MTATVIIYAFNQTLQTAIINIPSFNQQSYRITDKLSANVNIILCWLGSVEWSYGGRLVWLDSRRLTTALMQMFFL